MVWSIQTDRSYHFELYTKDLSEEARRKYRDMVIKEAMKVCVADLNGLVKDIEFLNSNLDLINA